MQRYRSIAIVLAIALFAAIGGVFGPSLLATDDLIGYYETSKDKERTRIPGALDGFNLSSDDTNAIIMKARVKAGWIEEPVEQVAEESEGEEPAEA